MPRRVMASIRSVFPLARGPARFARLEVVIVGPADDQVPGGGLGAVGDPDRPASVDQAEVDQVVADPGGQFPAAGPVRGDQQHVPSGQVGGDVGAGGLVDGLVGGAPRIRPACWSYSSRVVVSPWRRRRGGGAFPGGGEPDRFEQDATERSRGQ